MSEELDDARKKLDSEFAQVRESLGEVHVAFNAVLDAEPTDDLHDLLLALEKAAADARDGGLIGSGANGHRRALKKYRELKESGSW